MKPSALLLACTWLNLAPALAQVTVLDAEDSMAKYYPDLVKSPDYLGGITITNGTDVATPGGAVSDIGWAGAGLGIALAYTLGSGYTSVRNMKADCVGGKDGDLGLCAADVLHATLVHAGGAYTGHRYGTAWVWAYLAAQNQPDAQKRSLSKRSCGSTSSWPIGAHFNANIGMKMTCKAGCLQPSFTQLVAAADLLKSGYVFGQKMEDLNSGAFEFTVYKHGGDNDGKVFMRCHWVAQLDHPDSCPAEVSGSGCQL